MSDVFRTAFPYIFLIIFLKTVFLWKEEILVIREKWNVSKAVSVAVIFLFSMIVLIREGVFAFDSIGSVVGFALVFLILAACSLTIFLESDKANIFLIAGASLFGIFSATGNQKIFDVHGWQGWICSVISWSFLFGCALQCCYRMSHKNIFFENVSDKKDYVKYGILTFILSVFIDSVFLLVFYPGVMNYDAFVQMCQVTGGYSYSNHHPWLHTMIIKGIWELGLKLFHNTNKAYALYCLFSLISLSFAFSCVVAYLRKKGLKTIWTIAVLLFYIISPVNQMFSISMIKDVPFAIFILFFIILLCNMRDRRMEGKSNTIYWMLFIPISFGICFFRSNGLYVFIGMIPFIIFCFWNEKKEAILAIGSIIVLGLIFKGPVFEHFDVNDPDPIESLSIPAQQIAAVFYYDGVITNDQIDLLNHIVDTGKLSDAWNASPGCSDEVKNLVRETDNQSYLAEHKTEFLKLYLDMFRSNKRIYVKAFINETYGYWYHRVRFPFLWATYIEDNGMGICRDSKVPDFVLTCFQNYLSWAKRCFDCFFSVGLIVYAFFTAFFIVLQKKSKYIITYLPIFGIWCTLLLATPVYADLRYAYAIYNAVPILLCLAFDDVMQNP